MGHQSVEKNLQENNSKTVQDLEVKDAQIIFNAVWNSLCEDLEENLRFPKEIFGLTELLSR